MKSRLQMTFSSLRPAAWAFSAAALLLGGTAQAINFNGNGNTGFGGTIGLGVLSLTDDGTNISGVLTCDGSLNDALVIYIDTGAGGGFANTSGFADNNDGNRAAISGYNGSARSLMTFASGFRPQYAIALAPAATGFGGIWQLANGGANSLPYVNSVGLSPTGTGNGPFTFSFPAANLGLTPGVKTSINIFGTLVGTSGYRSTEAIAGNDTSLLGPGWNAFSNTAFATYVFDAGAPTLTPVKFSVDMTEEIALGNFMFGGDTVYAAGSFQTNAWGSGFQLTNNLMSGNPYIYTGVYQDQNPTNTAEEFKFYQVHAGSGATNWEYTDNRPFTLNAGGTTNATNYFNDLVNSPSATTNYVTFQVDMTPQVANGNFVPGTDSVQVFGTFNLPPQFVMGFVLTNNPHGANPYLYTGTTNDGNYPGSWEQYKYLFTTPTTTNYENGANRDFTTPTNSGTLPVVYYNNVSNIVTEAVTFQVDMTVPIEEGNVVLPGTVVSVIGSFQSPAYSGGALTNNPAAANTNLFTGTFNITAEAGTVFQYKFTYINGTTTNYEQPTSTDGQNRLFALASSAQALPLAFWSDEAPNDILPVATAVTFTVNMAGAVDYYGTPFDSNNDVVLINGTLPPSLGFIGDLWTDGSPATDYYSNIMSGVSLTSTLYTNTFVFPAGSPQLVTYKYGIDHHAYSAPANSNCDNEAGFNQNHTRYIRATGTYNMPVDIFGQQATNLAAATEPSFGNLTAGFGPAGQVALSWLGRPGVYLQMTTDLTSGTWTTVSNSGVGISATNLPVTGNAFFRLYNP